MSNQQSPVVPSESTTPPCRHPRTCVSRANAICARLSGLSQCSDVPMLRCTDHNIHPPHSALATRPCVSLGVPPLCPLHCPPLALPCLRDSLPSSHEVTGHQPLVSFPQLMSIPVYRPSAAPIVHPPHSTPATMPCVSLDIPPHRLLRCPPLRFLREAEFLPPPQVEMAGLHQPPRPVTIPGSCQSAAMGHRPRKRTYLLHSSRSPSVPVPPVQISLPSRSTVLPHWHQNHSLPGHSDDYSTGPGSRIVSRPTAGPRQAT
mmetsp:Transcript_59798/g.122696  ORF Transcript_59798/g.122696 Transcript_59798/m.122696 type:complete len:260 (+) Transcript_59798:2585-3364(+)